MTNLQRRIYGAVLRLHPAAFRNEFGREMALDFQEAVPDHGFTPLLGDAVLSLARQWKARALAGSEIEYPLPSHPFLAGQYCMIDQGLPLTMFDLARASVVSILLLLTIVFGVSVPNRRATANVQTVRVSHDGGIDTGGDSFHAADPGRREAAGARELQSASGDGIPRLHFTTHLRPVPAVGAWSLADALRQSTIVSVIVWLTSFFLRRSPGIGIRVVLAALGLIGIAGSVALGQVSKPPAHAQILHATAPLPSYEVATIKPWDGTGFGFPLRTYILRAFNLPASSVTRLIGPEWIDKTSYAIQGKPADSERDAMQKMTPEERSREMQLLQQSLLADRFKLKVHFETREMPVYELALAKGGSKLRENTDSSKGSAAMGRKGQMSELRGIALPMPTFIGFLMSDADIDGRTVIDKTGLAGAYDVHLEWVPSRLPAPPQPGSLIQPGSYGAAPTPDTEGPSLFTAIEEQLGLKLVATKGSVEVVVIDHIERPSEN